MTRRSTLAVRLTAVCVGVAVAAVLVAGLVAGRLATSSGREVARESLAGQADVVAGQLAAEGPGSRAGLRRVAEVLDGQDIDVVLLGGIGPGTGQGLADPVSRAAVRQTGVRPGAATSDTVRVGEGTLLVEARSTGPGSSVTLVQRSDRAAGIGRRLIRNIALALLVGLAVAVLAGVALADVLARPLRRVASVTAGMGGGRRDLRAPVEGPREVADVAAGVNALADALARSEGRQREFLLSVSHELRTPLTAVTGFAESLADGVVTGDRVPAVGATIGAEAARLDRLIGDLLDLARLGADDFRLDITDVDLTELVAAAGTVWAARCATAGVPFSTELPGHPVPVRTDPRRLRQVLDGLAENALRVTPAGRPIVFALTEPATLHVRDGGPGLAPEDYPVAFDRGVLHTRYAGVRPVGTGLGLALVRGLVDRLGGTVEAGPAPEGGAAFTVRLRRS